MQIFLTIIQTTIKYISSNHLCVKWWKPIFVNVSFVVSI